MAGATSKLSILIEAKNQASPAIKSVEGDLKGLDSAASSISGGLAGLAGAAGIAGIVALGSAAAGAAMEMARASAETDRLGTAFDTLAGQAGQSGDAMLAAMNEAAQGTVSNADLMASANRAMMLGVADSAQEMAQLMDVASARGKAMGESTAQAFSDLVTGIGRMSPMILDNLGITVDATKANEAYAEQIGKVASQLTDAEKKQALLNAVVQSSTDIVDANKNAGMDAASNFERMDAAITNAKDAMGELFQPAMVIVAQAIANAAEAATRGMQEMSGEAAIAGLSTADMAAQMVTLQEEIARITTQMDTMAATGQAGSDMYNQMGTHVKDLQGQLGQLAAAHNKLIPSIELANQDFEATSISAEKARAAIAAAAAAAFGATTGLDAMGNKLSWLTEQLAALKAQSDATSSALAGITSSAISSLHSAASAAVGLIPTGDIAKIYDENSKKIAEQVKVMKQVGMTTSEIDFKTQEFAKNASAPFDIAVEAAREADKALNRHAKNVDQLSKEYTALEGTVSSVLQAALDPGVGVDPQKMLEKMGVPRADDINENARRLADIAANGLKNQDWLGEFQKEVPDIWKMIRLAQNPQEEAAHLLQDFQDGLLTSPIDKGKAKEIIKRQIMGDQNMAALATEIATELAAEMGIPMQQALAAAQGSLGGSGGMGTEAATSFADGASAALDSTDGGGAFVTKFKDQMVAQYGLLAQAGKDAAKIWGSNFLSVVGENVPPALINILVDLTTPGVIAALAQKGSLTGATP